MLHVLVENTSSQFSKPCPMKTMLHVHLATFRLRARMLSSSSAARNRTTSNLDSYLEQSPGTNTEHGTCLPKGRSSANRGHREHCLVLLARCMKA